MVSRFSLHHSPQGSIELGTAGSAELTTGGAEVAAGLNISHVSTAGTFSSSDAWVDP